MSSPVSPADLPQLFSAAVAWCDPAGVLRVCNAAFEEWAGDAVGARVEISGGRGALFVGEGDVRPLTMLALDGGGWLALGGPEERYGAVAAVSAIVARRLERVEDSLESNAQTGLLLQPPEPVANCLRETLATAEELRLLRRQVAAFGLADDATPVPTCIRALARDARMALRGRAIRLDVPEGDYTVELDRGRFFAVLVGLLDELAAGATADTPLVLSLRSGDQVRMRLDGAELFHLESPALDAARRAAAAAGGRLVSVGGHGVTLELPAYGRSLEDGAAHGFGTVLIVDDDESALAMMGTVLRRAGYRVLSAGDGVAASSLLRQHLREIVAIVADAVLPGRSGLELAAEARRSMPHLPVLLVSGHSSALLGASAMDGLPILPKPFGARALAERVRALLEAADG